MFFYTGSKVDSSRSGGPGSSNPTTPAPHGPDAVGPARPFRQSQAMGLVGAVLRPDGAPTIRCYPMETAA